MRTPNSSRRPMPEPKMPRLTSGGPAGESTDEFAEDAGASTPSAAPSGAAAPRPCMSGLLMPRSPAASSRMPGAKVSGLDRKVPAAPAAAIGMMAACDWVSSCDPSPPRSKKARDADPSSPSPALRTATPNRSASQPGAPAVTHAFAFGLLQDLTALGRRLRSSAYGTELADRPQPAAGEYPDTGWRKIVYDRNRSTKPKACQRLS